MDDLHPGILPFMSPKGPAGVATSKVESICPKPSDAKKKSVITTDSMTPDFLEAEHNSVDLLMIWSNKLWDLDGLEPLKGNKGEADGE